MKSKRLVEEKIEAMPHLQDLAQKSDAISNLYKSVANAWGIATQQENSTL